MLLEVTLSQTLSKTKPLLQFAAADSKLKTGGKGEGAGSGLFPVHTNLCLVNPTSGI